MNATDPFESVVNEFYQPLYRFALSLTRAAVDAQDLTQQAFYVWATKGHQLRDSSKIRSWLFTTLHRAFLVSRRRQERFQHCDLEEASPDLPTVSFEADRLDSPQVLSALAKVDKLFQPAVALFYLEDFSYKDIAEALEVPIGTVKSRIARGIAELRQAFLAEGAHSKSPAHTGS